LDGILAIFAKAPVAGRVKTRLCPPLSPDQAAALSAAFLCDTVGKALRAVARPALTYDGDRAILENALTGAGIAPDRLDWVPQGGGDLGARMSRVPAPCVIVGTDSPTLPPAALTEAFEIVAAGDIALVPAEDGGYALIGLPRPMPEIFVGVSWSTASVLCTTLANAERIGVQCVLLRKWYDVDTPADLVRMGGDLDAGEGECPHTRRAWVEIRRCLSLTSPQPPPS
jgi:rSAM/selenodomain-associated transferase 1